MTSLSPNEIVEFRNLSAEESRTWAYLNDGAASTLDPANERAWQAAARRKRTFLEARDLDGMFVSLRDGSVSPRE